MPLCAIALVFGWILIGRQARQADLFREGSFLPDKWIDTDSEHSVHPMPCLIHDKPAE